MTKEEDPSGERARAERQVAARQQASADAVEEQAEGTVAAYMLRLQAMKRDGEFPYKTPDGRIDIPKTLMAENPFIEAVATLANGQGNPDDVVSQVAPMVRAIELLGSTLREVHEDARSSGFTEDAVSITTRYATVVSAAIATSRRLLDEHEMAFSEWSTGHNAPELAPPALRARIDAVESAIHLEREDTTL